MVSFGESIEHLRINRQHSSSFAVPRLFPPPVGAPTVLRGNRRRGDALCGRTEQCVDVRFIFIFIYTLTSSLCAAQCLCQSSSSSTEFAHPRGRLTPAAIDSKDCCELLLNLRLSHG